MSEIASSMWASMNSWFTPAVFFVLLNLMIGTIALTSTLSKKSPSPNPKTAGSVLQRLKSTNFYPYFNRSQDPYNPPIYKQAPPDSNLETETHYFFQFQAPQPLSIDKQTLFDPPQQSKNLETQSHFFFEQPHELDHQDSNLGDFERAHQEEVVEGNEEAQSMDEVFSKLTGTHFSRTKSDTDPASGEVTAKLPTKMKKSASLKSAFGHFEEEKIVEARRPATVRERGKVADGDVEVDAKADDFINRFKQQLKLQRLDSIVRYKDMIGRGGAGGR